MINICFKGLGLKAISQVDEEEGFDSFVADRITTGAPLSKLRI